MFAVLFLVVIASLSAAAMLTATAAERMASVRSVEDLELRLAVRSALTVMTADLARQRDDLLSGDSPSAPRAVRIDRGKPDDDTPPPGILVEFVPFADDRVLVPESARLDLNTAPIDAIASLPGLPDGLADAIDRGRRIAPFRSPVEVLGLVGSDQQSRFADPPLGLPDRSLDSPTDSAFDIPSAGSSQVPTDTLNRSSVASMDASDPDDPGGNAWLDFLTVYSADPTVSTGSADSDRTGSPRVNVNAPWSDRIEQALLEAAGDSADESLRTLFVDAPMLRSPSVLVGLLAENGVPQEQWGALLDAITTTPDLYRLGLVDLNRAPAEVLAGLPGLDAASAESIVSARDRLDLNDRRSIDWPLSEGILDESQFRACVDSLTTRSLQWRFMLRASFEPEQDSFIGFDPDDTPADLLPQADEFGVAIEDDTDEDTGPSLLFEVVLDLAGDRPRIAYLRERTAYDLALAVAAIPGMNRNATEPRSEFESDEEFDVEPMGSEFATGATGTGIDAGFGDADDNEFGFGDSGDFFSLGDDATDDAGLLGFDEQPTDAPPSEAVPSGRSRTNSPASEGGGGRDTRLGRWAPSRGPRRSEEAGNSPGNGGRR